MTEFNARKAFLAGLASLICGCATQAPKEINLDAHPGEGIIVFAVSHDASGGHVSTLWVQLDRVSGKSLTNSYPSVESKGTIRLASDFDDDHGRLAVVNLPAGRHELSTWRFSNGTGLYISPEKDPPPLQFEVNAGAVVYLGDIHGVVGVGRNLLGIKSAGDVEPEVRDRHERDIAVFESKYPQFRNKATVQLLPTGTWAAGRKTAHVEVAQPLAAVVAGPVTSAPLPGKAVLTKPALRSGYACCNLHYEDDWISDGNYGSLPMIAVGTPVDIVSLGRHKAHVLINGNKMRLGHDYGRAQESLDFWLKKIIVADDPRPTIASYTPDVRSAIAVGRLLPGMTRDQVLVSIGYPNPSENPSLEAPVWRYWLSDGEGYELEWGKDGKLNDVSAVASVRKLILYSPEVAR
jgi:hypothetical protein